MKPGFGNIQSTFMGGKWTSQNAPSNLIVTPITGGNRLTWQDNTSNEDGFKILVSINNSAFVVLAIVEAGVTTYDDLVSTGVLAYRVIAYKGLVYSDYSDEVSITTVTIITDGDGNVYTEVTVGNQIWLNRDLITTKFLDGTAIANDVTAGWITKGDAGTPCFRYANDNIANKTDYGNIYNWYCAHNVKAIAPAGYHVPTKAELDTLFTQLGGLSVAGTHCKSIGTTYWNNAGGDNSSGLGKNGNGCVVSASFGFQYWKDYSQWWAYDELDGSNGKYSQFGSATGSVTQGNSLKRAGFSIRCIKN